MDVQFWKRRGNGSNWMSGQQSLKGKLSNLDPATSVVRLTPMCVRVLQVQFWGVCFCSQHLLLFMWAKSRLKNQNLLFSEQSQASGPGTIRWSGGRAWQHCNNVCVVKITYTSYPLRPRVRSDPNLLRCCLGSLEVGIQCQLLLEWEHRKAMW